MQLRLELTVEPFTDGEPGPHVMATIGALRDQGLQPEVGPFGTTAEAPLEQVLQAVASALAAAFGHGATGLALSVRTVPTLSPEATAFVAAVRPVVAALGATIIEVDQIRTGDQPLLWEGVPVAGVRPPESATDLQGTVPRLVAQAERTFGRPLAELSREDKQRAALWLEQRGAFALRNSTEIIADAMGVSRGTIYNYLHVVRTRGATDDATCG